MPSSEPDSCSSPGSQTTASPDAIGSRPPSAPLTQPEPLDDCEQLEARGRVPGDHAAGLDLDHDDVRAGRQPPHTSAHASGAVTRARR